MTEPYGSQPIPKLDDLMPPLDRQGRRGRFTREEQDYEKRRKELRLVLERLALAEPQAAMLNQRMADRARDLSQSLMICHLLTDLTRLSGFEPDTMKLLFEDRQLVVTFVLGAFIVEYRPGKCEFTIAGNGQQAVVFSTDNDGHVPIKELLAVKGLMGVGGAPEEIYPRRIFDRLFGEPSDLRAILGRIRVGGALVLHRHSVEECPVPGQCPLHS